MTYRLVLSTIPNEKFGKQIAKQLLAKKLCACVNIIPKLSSHYWWKGKIESAGESLLLIKTTQSKVKSLFAAIKKLHPYESPEIIAVEIKEGIKSYLDWISANVS